MDGWVLGSPNGKVTLPRAFFEAKDVRPLEARQRLPSVFSASCSSVVDPKTKRFLGQVVMVVMVGQVDVRGVGWLFFFWGGWCGDG